MSSRPFRTWAKGKMLSSWCGPTVATCSEYCIPGKAPKRKALYSCERKKEVPASTAGTSHLFLVQVKLGCTALAIQTLVLVFFRALSALLLASLSALLSARLTMLTRLSALTCLSTLLTVLLHVVCH